MATLPRARVSVDPTASAPGGGTDLVCVLAPVATAPDLTPRLYGSAAAVAAVHGYSEGVEYVDMHLSGTAKPVLFVGMPIGTAGAVSRSTGHANTGTSVVSVTAGGDGILAEHDGVLRVVAGGTIGTDQIKLELSLDGGRSFQPIRLGTSNSFVVPNVNATISFAAGTLIAEDVVLEWHGSAPKATTSDFAVVRAALAALSFRFRSLLLCGDLPDAAAATSLVTQLNAYATSNDRHVFGRASVPDQQPIARMGQVVARLTGSPTLTFAEVGGTGDTVTRDSGSWTADGFVVGDTVTFVGTASNNVTGPIASLSATVLTFGTTDLVAEVVSVSTGVTVVGGPTLTFAEVGATGDTLTRSRGSFLVDGFRVGATIDSSGTASNNFTDAAITAVTATVLTLNTQDVVAESIRASLVTLTAGESKAEWMARVDGVFANIDGQPRLDLSAGRGAFPSGYSGWLRRVPAGWLASVREYQHDLHVATWRKDLGPLGADLFDANNELVEWDERVDGGAGLAARFTTLRTWANGPRGAFISMSLTRAGDGQIASLTHNEAVINDACNTVQLATENVIGRSLILNEDGTATKDSLAVIASEVNAALELELTSSRGEGPRASRAVWTPNPADVYNVPESLMTGTLDLILNGTVHSVSTQVRIRTNGQ
jgi:hypothetical protein